jgi:rsbT co-antagonist protein RsbR
MAKETELTAVQALEEEVREEVIAEAQKVFMKELATPVIQVWQGIVLMPLVGVIDTVRAQQLMENLLQRIVETESTVAILDIKGVPVVDTKVAAHLLESIEAARMLGARCIITGISPHNAQTLVKLGVDLSGVITRNTLRAGLEEAFRMLGLKVVRVEGQEP